MKMKIFLFKISGLVLIALFSTLNQVETVESTPKLHSLLTTKDNLEKKFGIETLECFPFIKNIGFTTDQKSLIQKCLNSAKTLEQALTEIPLKDLRTVGISNQFMWVGGFQGMLIPWGATKEEISQFLSERFSKEAQNSFMEKIRNIKQRIHTKISIGDLYCTKIISNKQCLTGYQNLFSAVENLVFKNKHWTEVAITNSFDALKDPRILTLKFDTSPTELMDVIVFQDIQKVWKLRKEMYEIIEEQYGESLHRRLQLGNFICDVTLTSEECLEGAQNLHKASPALQKHPWGIVTIHKYNTLILDDHDAVIRYNLNYSKIVRYFSAKPTTKETQKNNTLAKNLEERSKNNPTKLRVVCDLEGLHSNLCVEGFKKFFQFLKKNPAYKASSPRETLMIVDGNQLARVNFALNSGTRKNYIYVDAKSSIDEFETHLKDFEKKQK